MRVSFCWDSWKNNATTRRYYIRRTDSANGLILSRLRDDFCNNPAIFATSQIFNSKPSNVERDKADPSSELIERFRQSFGGDIHVLAWCLVEDDEGMPKSLRVHREQHAAEWRRLLAEKTA